MKKLFWPVLTLCLLGVVLTLYAQTASPWQVGVSSAIHTSCTVIPSSTQYCFASDGLWQSLNGAAYTQITTGSVPNLTGTPPITVAGGVISCPACAQQGNVVTSFGNPPRTGAVIPVSGDYSYGQLSNLPTTTGLCTGGQITGTATINANTTGGVVITLTNAQLTGCGF